MSTTEEAATTTAKSKETYEFTVRCARERLVVKRTGLPLPSTPSCHSHSLHSSFSLSILANRATLVASWI
jgi:hypothetical protein